MGSVGDVYFWRQSVVLTADCMHSIGTGFMLSFPAVLQPAILSLNSTGIHATLDQASWVAEISSQSSLVLRSPNRLPSVVIRALANPARRRQRPRAGAIHARSPAQ
ncbi:jg25732 [Pararge aegeria aegeria]|uniref:Jg25732 protein n=1 Tax=Pararge aegeria aegeria TaxID=348720 RepID=A0A8S4QUI6_9NEOP|nr:jg25732 [Pararge aegeria aegeria]